jgi:glycosyltransferase involved in cell wall biosynthesis
MKISLVINTFDQPDYLARVLAAVAAQTRLPDEVLLADDGSGQPTRDLFSTWTAGRPFRTFQAWQPHEGFRRARILNLSIAAARGDYLIFIDGDTVPHPCFLDDHAAAARPGCFVQGHRAIVKLRATAWFGKAGFVADRRRALLQNQIANLQNSFRWPLALCRVKDHLRGIRGCNLGVWHTDLRRVNGYNEDFAGWGREDSELAARLFNAGFHRLDLNGRAVCFHLWHAPASRARLRANDALLAAAVRQKLDRCAHGLDQHLSADG